MSDFQSELQKAMTKSLIRYCDMNSELSTEAVDVVISAIDKHQSNLEECAKQIKDTMDKRFGASWHVIIGGQFGFEITHQQQNLLYMFYQGDTAILVFKG